MFRKIVFQIVVLLILAGIASAADPKATIGTGNGQRGDTVQVPVTLTNVPGVGISAVSLDVGFDVNVLENPSAVVGPAGTAAEKIVAFNPNFSPGVMRVALIGFNQNVIGEGIIFYVSFKIKSTAAIGHTVLTNKPSGSTPDARLVTMSGVNGTINVLNQQCVLTVDKTGTGSGTVGGSGTYDCGSTVTITAKADAGSILNGWTGDEDCTDGNVTINADKTCTAIFTMQEKKKITCPASIKHKWQLLRQGK